MENYGLIFFPIMEQIKKYPVQVLQAVRNRGCDLIFFFSPVVMLDMSQRVNKKDTAIGPIQGFIF